VKRFNADKGFGFTAQGAGTGDVLGHRSAFEADGPRSLQERQRIKLTVGQRSMSPGELKAGPQT
jgi:cold shock CspA family protein